MNEDGTMNAKAGKYNGMARYECRKEIVKDLEEAGLLVSVKDHAYCRDIVIVAIMWSLWCRNNGL